MSAPDQTPAARVRFDPVLNWGHILIFVGIIASAIGIYQANELRAQDHEYRIKSLEILMTEGRVGQTRMTDQLNTILIELSAMKVRLPSPQSNARPLPATP